MAAEETIFGEACALAVDVVYQGGKGVTDLMVRPGLINLDFADVRAVMDEMGKAMMGTGEATGEDRAIQAAEKAIANPLLDEISLRGARGVLINITGGHDLTLFELDEAANRIREEVDPDANIIVGSTLDEAIEGGMRVSVVATGIDALDVQADIPTRRPMRAPLEPHVLEQPVEEAPVAAPVEEVVAETAESNVVEPSLFGDLETERAAAADQMEDIFEARSRAVIDDDDALPPPAYQPRVAAFPTHDDTYEEDEVESFVAPKAPALGTPSPEVLQRLKTAASKAPSAPARPLVAAEAPRAEEAKRGGFGLNSLIGRMTGHSGEQQPRSAQPQMRQQPGMQAVQPQPAVDEEQDRIEIPAFLRRQAN